MSARPSITFDLQSDSARILRHAAADLRLPVVELPDATFRVELRSPLDVYVLAEWIACDPAWARLLLERS